MWIKQIFDGDYGCEELQPGEKPKVSVMLVDVAGNEKFVSVEDDWLTENGLNVGSTWPLEVTATGATTHFLQKVLREF
ncbi:hypothetical protein [Butyrivibrio sp. INlla14]|uniref:hypothetical protein n=1 Tax=Butyrivibrio sp. INlla14 TaxID=1520808 RepID=UPI0008773100|nr:hypothetical protein [Butyrivibrio sp. INlla14]SCY10526.1 hypothetical protein SAMN02910371_01079 [Butyrivibrio sp. INlla14]